MTGNNPNIAKHFIAEDVQISFSHVVDRKSVRGRSRAERYGHNTNPVITCALIQEFNVSPFSLDLALRSIEGH